MAQGLPRTIIWILLVLPVGAIALCGSGCSLGRSQGVWREPPPPVPGYGLALAQRLFGHASSERTTAEIARLRTDLAASGDPLLVVRMSESRAAAAYQAEDVAPLDAVARYQEAATLAWSVMFDGRLAQEHREQASRLYHGSLARLLCIAQRETLFVPGVGVVFQTADGQRAIPISIEGFAWRLEDFQEVHPVGKYRTRSLAAHHTRTGLGVPVVVSRTKATGTHLDDEFLSDGDCFAATVLLSPESGGTLAFYNPLTTRCVASHGVDVPLASDISAPFAYRLIKSPSPLDAWSLFLRPDALGDPEGLFFLEPYQPGKIPVVMVHGLLSSPGAWIDMANELRAQPGFTDRYQIWAFRYPTGAPFLRAATDLRRSLDRAVAMFDADGCDPALHNMVLIGHSMGGLIAKCQVASSGDILWASAANRPFDLITADDAMRCTLAELFFFEPRPYVRRVIYIATPHGGSSWASRWFSRIGAIMVRRTPDQVAEHAELIDANPGVFSDEIARRIPTSIDMLEPNSELLQAVRALPTSPCVQVHSVIGDARWMLHDGRGDGIVGVASAHSNEARSELLVDTRHMVIHKDADTITEVGRILDQHWMETTETPVVVERAEQ